MSVYIDKCAQIKKLKEIIDMLNNGDYINEKEVDKLLKYDNAVLLFMSSKEIYILEDLYKKALEEKID